jgi:hypothetical protein
MGMALITIRKNTTSPKNRWHYSPPAEAVQEILPEEKAESHREQEGE